MGVNLAATLPELLRGLRMTQEELAEATGIRRTDINALARGRIEAGPKRLRLIAEALGVREDELGEASPTGAGATPLPRRLEALEEEVAILRRFVAALARGDDVRPAARTTAQALRGPRPAPSESADHRQTRE